MSDPKTTFNIQSFSGSLNNGTSNDQRMSHVSRHSALSGLILPNRTLVNPGGMDYSIIETLANRLNFSFNLLTPPDGSWGAPDENGNWTGLMGMIQQSEADMAISTISISESRLRVVSFSNAYYFDSAVLVSRDNRLAISANLFFIQPFSIEVWCLVVMAIMVQWALTSTIDKHLHNKTDKIGFRTISLWLKQNFTWTGPVDFKLILGLFLLMANLIASLYGSTLTSSTSVASKVFHIDTIDDMSRAVIRDDYLVTTQKDSVFEDIIKTSQTLHMGLIKPMMALNMYKTPEGIKKALLRLLTEKRIFIFYKSGLQSLVDNMTIREDLHFSKEELFSDRLAIAFHKSFRCKEIINQELRLLDETGLISYWHFDMMRSYFYRQYSKGKWHRVTQDSFIVPGDLFNLIYMAGVGLSLATISLVLEITGGIAREDVQYQYRDQIRRL